MTKLNPLKFLVLNSLAGLPSQYVRDTCQFDLECPIRGVGPGVVRKLLLEENLKIRGRKDNKVRKNPEHPTDYTFTFKHICGNSIAIALNFYFFWSHVAQLEVVALLFSDVLLMTKVHKKGERLKVVRPPLALDRTHCVALKDGCESHLFTSQIQDFFVSEENHHRSHDYYPSFSLRLICSHRGG